MSKALGKSVWLEKSGGWEEERKPWGEEDDE